jgi:hypothetical protein
VAKISYVREPSSAATTTSTRSPFILRGYREPHRPERLGGRRPATIDCARGRSMRKVMLARGCAFAPVLGSDRAVAPSAR